MKQIDLREGARRQHRSIALFAVVQCWLRDLDGVVFDRSQLERMLGLKRFKNTRVEWMKEDFEEFFPFRVVYKYTKNQDSFASLFVSRRKLEGSLPKASMSNARIIKGIAESGPRLAIFDIWPQPNEETVLKAFEAAIPFFADAANYDERLLASYLALLSQGQISPRSLPSLRK